VPALVLAGLLIVILVAVIGSSYLAPSSAEAEGEAPGLRKGWASASQVSGYKSQDLAPLGGMPGRSGTVGKPREVGFAFLFVGVAAFLGLLATVEEEVSVVGELLDAGESVLVGVEARFQETQRER
jgi:hypothetical protein